ncbi:MAG: hypothetical protein P4L61_04045, partial [Candidatus Pacebacteria bacterium]|nr:hypothetical protein [Candidatus Paceibacterota bacterium]
MTETDHNHLTDKETMHPEEWRRKCADSNDVCLMGRRAVAVAQGEKGGEKEKRARKVTGWHSSGQERGVAKKIQGNGYLGARNTNQKRKRDSEFNLIPWLLFCPTPAGTPHSSINVRDFPLSWIPLKVPRTAHTATIYLSPLFLCRCHIA